MIEISYTISKDGRHELTMSGHAGTAPEGQDLVCAAVTAHAYCLSARLQVLRKEGKAHGVVIDLDKGDSRIGATPAIHDRDVGGAYATIIAGLYLLAQNYPDNVRCACHVE